MFAMTGLAKSYVSESCLEDEVVFPEQLLGEVVPRNGQLELRVAILEQAVHDVEMGMRRGARKRDRLLAAESIAWILEDGLWWPFSFESLCSVLRIDSCAMRERLLWRWGKRQRFSSLLRLACKRANSVSHCDTPRA